MYLGARVDHSTPGQDPTGATPPPANTSTGIGGTAAGGYTIGGGFANPYANAAYSAPNANGGYNNGPSSVNNNLVDRYSPYNIAGGPPTTFNNNGVTTTGTGGGTGAGGSGGEGFSGGAGGPGGTTSNDGGTGGSGGSNNPSGSTVNTADNGGQVMTSQQALQLLQTGNGTPDQLAQANKIYYGTSTNPGTYNPAATTNTNTPPANGTQQPDANGVYAGNYNPGGGYNPNQYATQQTAQQLANQLGGKVVSTNALASPVSNPAQMNQNEIQLANGFTGNAGLMNQFIQAFGPQRAMQMFQDQAALGGSGTAANMNGGAAGTNMFNTGPAQGSSVANSAPTYTKGLGTINTSQASNYAPNWGSAPASQTANPNPGGTSPYTQGGFANPMLGLQSLNGLGALTGNLYGQNPNAGYNPYGAMIGTGGYGGLGNLLGGLSQGGFGGMNSGYGSAPNTSMWYGGGGNPQGNINMVYGTGFGPGGWQGPGPNPLAALVSQFQTNGNNVTQYPTYQPSPQRSQFVQALQGALGGGGQFINGQLQQNPTIAQLNQQIQQLMQQNPGLGAPMYAL